jgi:hypothetical protein
VRLVNLDDGDLVMDVARVVVEENGEEVLEAARVVDGVAESGASAGRTGAGEEVEEPEGTEEPEGVEDE